MTHEELVLALLARANPEPEESLEQPLDSAAYLATIRDIDSESADVSRPYGVRRPTKARPFSGSPVAGAAVLMVIVGVALLMPSPDSAPPANLTTVEAILEAHVSGDAERVMELLGPDAAIGVEITQEPAQYAAALQWFQVTGYDWSIDACEEVAEGGGVICPMLWSNAWSRTLDSGPYAGEFRFVFADGQVTGFFLSFGIARGYGSVVEEVEALRVENYDQFREEMYEGGLNRPRLTSESILLWEQLTAEFMARHSG